MLNGSRNVPSSIAGQRKRKERFFDSIKNILRFIKVYIGGVGEKRCLLRNFGKWFSNKF